MSKAVIVCVCVRVSTTARNYNHNPISRIASTLVDIADTWVDKKKRNDLVMFWDICENVAKHLRANGGFEVLKGES